MFSIFKIISAVLNLYALICLARILITWIPGVGFSPVGKILSEICDPYLNFFRRLRILSFSGLDFSPAIAICVLYGLATVSGSLAAAHTLSVSYFINVFITLAWSLVNSIINFLIFILIIRLAALLIMKLMTKSGNYRSYSPFWDTLDRIISPVAYKISGIFYKGMISYTMALAIAIIFCLASVWCLNIAISYICLFVAKIPF